MIDTKTLGLIIGIGFGAAISIPLYADRSVVEPLPAFAYCAHGDTTPILEGSAAYVFDVESGTVLFEKNGEAQLPLASLSKIMTVYASLEVLGPDDLVRISEDALSPEGDWGLKIGDEWRAQDLASYTLIESSNDGARALVLAASQKLGMSEEDFIEAMNRRARGLNLTQTYFINETGLDVSSVTAGAYGSARDIASLFTHIALTAPDRVEQSVMPRASFTSLSGKAYTAQNTALLASAYGSAIGSKTGFTDLAGGNLALVFEPLPGRPVAITVLGSSRDGRERDVEALADFASRALHRKALCAAL